MPRIFQPLLENWPVTAIGIGLLAIAVLFYGCESRPVVELNSGKQDAASACAGLLESGIDLIRPERLGVVGATEVLGSEAETAATTLSQWLRRPDCQAATPVRPLSEEDQALATRLLGADATARLADERIDELNAADLRDAFLDFQTAGTIAGQAENDLERVHMLFDYVTRTISPEAESSVALPLNGYEAGLFGRGPAESRAWLFSSLLRQLRIDAIIFRASDDPQARPWWVGVPVRGEILLFDCELGLPVPAADAAFSGEAAFPPAATWKQVLENPALLTEYRGTAGVETPAVDAEALKNSRVELMGPDTYWKKSVERLELSLQSDRGLLIYDPLHDTAAGPGLYQRVATMGEGLWPAEAIAVWEYPAIYRKSRQPGEFSSAAKQRLDQRVTPLLGPAISRDEENRPLLDGRLTKALWRTRIQQIEDAGTGTIGSLSNIRLAAGPDQELTARELSLNDQAADEAHYWAIHAQMSAGHWTDAIDTIDDYLRVSGDRADEARALNVLCLAKAGQWEAAIDAAGKLPETVPGRARYQWLAQWWKK